MFDVNVTSFTARVVEQALARRFRVEGRRQGGRLVILLNQRGRENTFGALYVGVRTGRITGAVLHRGNNDPLGNRYIGARAAAHAHPGNTTRPVRRAALRSLICSVDCRPPARPSAHSESPSLAVQPLVSRSERPPITTGSRARSADAPSPSTSSPGR